MGSIVCVIRFTVKDKVIKADAIIKVSEEEYITHKSVATGTIEEAKA